MPSVTTVARTCCLREGGVLRLEREAGAAVLRRLVNLGYTRLDIPSYTVASVDPAPDDPSMYVVRLTPPNDAAANVFERLAKSGTKAETAARRPPPPPPRKGKRRGARKRKR